MIRTPLRPLARILDARSKGENPDVIERENIRIRHEQMRDQARQRAEGRLLVLGLFFFVAFVTIGFRMGVLASSEPREPRVDVPGATIHAARADIVDRHGSLLATNFETHALYAQPPQIVDPVHAARELARIFPELSADELIEDFTGKRKFLWIKRKISPEQMQAVHEIGDPGLLFATRDMRLYPNGRLAAHVLGGASFGKEGVHAAEVIGVAGVEKYFDDYLRDPSNGDAPLQLSLDLTVQAAAEQVLFGGMKLMSAKGATSILMDVHTGEVISAVSLPTFDPNDRPRPATSGNAADSPLFNRSVQGVYELGSTFKIFTVAQAMDLGLAGPGTIVDTTGPLRWGRHRIRDFRYHGDAMSVTNVIVNSSNIGTARLAQEIGVNRHRDFLAELGMLEPTGFEIVEAATGRPLLPPNWSELSTMTISYGHGLSTSPMHLAAGYAAIANGGYKVKPTILKRDTVEPGPRVISEASARAARQMLREVVTEGTATFGEVAGYEVAGKTGTADKPRASGRGYYDEKVIATFASIFPAHEPKYVLIVTLDEPVDTTGDKPRRTAGWTAVPVAAEMIRRVAPLLGLRPTVEHRAAEGIKLSRN